MTAKKWLSVLEASYIIFPLQPFYKNFSKRLVKMPKMYFYDTGLACSLLNIRNEEQLKEHYLKGGLYENMVITEILKGRFNRAQTPDLYFWRDLTGHEIDLIAEWGGPIKAIEIKSGSTFQPDFIKNVRYFSELSKKEPSSRAITDVVGTDSVQGYLVYNGDYQGTHLETKLVPFAQVDSIFHE